MKSDRYNPLSDYNGWLSLRSWIRNEPHHYLLSVAIKYDRQKKKKKLRDKLRKIDEVI